TQRNGANGEHAAPALSRAEALRAAGLEEVTDDVLQEEIAHLSSENEQLARDVGFTLAEPKDFDAAAGARADAEKRGGQVAELPRALVEAREMQQALAEQRKEYEGLLEEKSEVIRELHRKLHEQPAHPAGSTPREEELLALSEELERERRQL